MLAKVATTPSLWSASRLQFTRKPVAGVLFNCEVVGDFAGMVVLRVVGQRAWELFQHESGGHRWQRVPPNERKDKVHSSTVTVAVFPEKPPRSFSFRESDCEITTCRGSGPGGQNNQKTDSAVQIKHKPSGMIVRCETERSQSQNKATALSLLASRLEAKHIAGQQASERDDRRSQIGTGERSDKIRTVQMQNGQVVNHVSGKKSAVEKYLKGDIWCVA